MTIFTEKDTDIVLATYNGEKYLAQQIDSIRANSAYQDHISRFIICDDHSTDSTKAIVLQYQAIDERIEWHVNTTGKTGPNANFSYGLSLSNAPLVMLSDQDDVWHEEKIVRTRSAIRLISTSTPALIFTDKRIVDEQLNLICQSYFELKKIPKSWHNSLANLMQQNVASGCTCIINRALMDVAMPIPDQAYMHDWWLAIVAKRFGHLELIDAPLIDYRQHGGNSIGAKPRSTFDLIRNVTKHYHKFTQSLNNIIQQAEAFKRLELSMDTQASAITTILADIPHSRARRIIALAKGQLYRSHWKGMLALILNLILRPVQAPKTTRPLRK